MFGCTWSLTEDEDGNDNDHDFCGKDDGDGGYLQLLIDCQYEATNRPTRQNNPLRHTALQPLSAGKVHIQSTI